MTTADLMRQLRELDDHEREVIADAVAEMRRPHSDGALARVLRGEVERRRRQ